MRKLVAIALSAACLAPAQDVPVFKASSNLVIVTVFVQDKKGASVAGLGKSDFTVLENGKPQQLSVFEYQNIESAAASATLTSDAPSSAVPTVVAAPAQPATPGSIRFRDRRLLILFFDWSSLGTVEQVRAKDAAAKFIREQMTPADLVAIASFGSKLKMDLEFTADRDELMRVIRRFQTGEMSELAENANTEESSDDAFAADETEFNLFNTDRKLSALEDLARKFSALPEKKAIIYLTAGVSRTGNENDSQLRSTINSAVRANVSIYPIDVRGLEATAPGGNASTASARGTGLYTGQTQSRQRGDQLQQQDTLVALAEDTGGKPLLDNNDLVVGIQQAQQDLRGYYVLGYYSADERRDGQFRRVEVKLTQQAQAKFQAKLDYRRGYFADKEFKAFSSYDKEKQLEDALLLGDPVVELPLALEVNWFRVGRGKYFVPVAVKVPGSAVPIAKKGSAETTQFDFIGQVKDAGGAQLSMVRDTIKIQLRDENTGQLPNRSLLYDTGFMLAPGRYTIKMLVRENLSGKMGTFETSFTIPDLATVKNDARLSSVVWSAQKIPVQEAVGAADKKLTKKQSNHPLVFERDKLLPSVTHVYRPGQTLFAYAELYDPVLPEPARQPAVSAAVTIYRDRKLVAQSRPLQLRAESPRRPGAAPLLIEMPLNNLPAGEYVAQLNVIDEAGQRFAYSRAPLVMLGR